MRWPASEVNVLIHIAMSSWLFVTNEVSLYEKSVQCSVVPAGSLYEL